MKIMFVCTGNAGCSTAAEAVLKKLIADNNIADAEVVSNGTGGRGCAGKIIKAK